VYNRYRREAIAHKQILPDQEFTFTDFVTMFLRNVASDYQAAMAEGEFLSSVIEIPRFRLMQFWGTYRGFRQEAPVSEQLWRRFYYPDKESYPSSTDHKKSDETSEDPTPTIDYSQLLDSE
jgi:hypothetical protein